MGLIDRDISAVWHPYTPVQGVSNLPIVRATGATLIDESGRAYLDAISSWWVTLHGHCHPEIELAISKQLSVLDQVIFAGCTHEPGVLLAEKLLRILPGSPEKIFFTDDGSTAVEVALKIALQYWTNRGDPRTRFLAFQNGYHGETFGAMSVGSRGVFNAPFERLLFDVHFIPPPMPGMEQEALRSLKRELEHDGTAAFIYEPLVQGAAGMRMYSPEMLEPLLSAARDRGILLIADEVFTGFGRTGRGFASEYMETKPDLIGLSKGLTGGVLPLGATAVSRTVFEAFDSSSRERMLYHGHSFTANPLACAAAVESIKLLCSQSTQGDIARIAMNHGNFVEQLKTVPGVYNPRSLGTILAMEFGLDSGYTHPIRDTLYAYFVENGLLLRPLGNTVYVVPPYCITDSELGTIYEIIIRAAGRFLP